MKASRFLILFVFVSLSLLVVGCNSGGGSSETGVITMSVTDAKPLLPENVTNVFVDFSEVWVHKPGEGWIELDLVESPYSIDLLQFQDGNTTELVPPAKLQSGKYTQVRIVVSKATLRFATLGEFGEVIETEDRTIEIPSGNLKTDKNFTIDLGTDSAMDIIIHFDLSMSVIVSGTAEEPVYKLKPVLHLFDQPLQAATIEGSIDFVSFGESDTATIHVISENNGEVYTQVKIVKSNTEDPTGYRIFWIIPNQEYTVRIDIDQDDTIECEKTVSDDLEADDVTPLPGGIANIGSCISPD